MLYSGTVGRPAGETFARIEEELVAERAAALRRIAERLEERIARLHELRRAMAAAGTGRAALLDAYRSAWQEARAYRWYLEVQREAVGLRRHEILDELYTVPGPPPS